MARDERDIIRTSTGDTTGYLSGAGHINVDSTAYSGSRWAGDSGSTTYTVGDIVSALKDVGILSVG